MAAIPSTYVLDQVPTPAQWNGPGLALAGMGILDDNGGKPIWAPSVGPLALSTLSGGAQAKLVGGTFTVPAGQLFLTSSYLHGVNGGASLTPAGGGAFVFTNATTQLAVWPLHVAVGPGDAVGCGNSGLLGHLGPMPAGVVRVLPHLTAGGTAYTVPAGQALLLLGVLCETGTSGALMLDAESAPLFPVDQGFGLAPVLLRAGQTVNVSGAGASALLSGLLYPA